MANLLGLKLDVHTDTSREASNLKDEVNEKDETQNEQQYRNAFDKCKSFTELSVFFPREKNYQGNF